MRYENGYYFQACVADVTKRALVECDEPIAPGYGGYYGTDYIGDPAAVMEKLLREFRAFAMELKVEPALGMTWEQLKGRCSPRFSLEGHDPGDEDRS